MTRSLAVVAGGVAVLLCAAAALAAVRFSGRTSQRQPISFSVSGGYVRTLDYRIVDRCPAHKKLINHDFGFTPIRITRSHFGGTFIDPAHDGSAVVSGIISGRRVKGSLSDRTRDARTGRICNGTAQFNLARR